MSEKIKSVYPGGFKERLKDAKDQVVDGVKSAANWCVEHPLLAISIAGGLASCGDKTYKAVKIHNENVRRRRTFYDPRKGRYTEARRDLRAYELDEIDARYDSGESYTHILMDMGLLK